MSNAGNVLCGAKFQQTMNMLDMPVNAVKVYLFVFSILLDMLKNGAANLLFQVRFSSFSGPHEVYPDSDIWHSSF